MKLLLDSAGILNASIHAALLDLLGKPIADARALCIPTAGYGHPLVSPERAFNFIAGKEPSAPMGELGWKSVGVLELTAPPSKDRARGTYWVREAEVLLVNGGDALYLAHWGRQSGLVDVLQTLPELVWVGLCAGSMVMTPRIGEAFVNAQPPIAADDGTLGIVDFAIFPHLDHPGFDGTTMAAAERWAAGIGCPRYAIDDETAIAVVDGVVDVVSEGCWRFFPEPGA